MKIDELTLSILSRVTVSGDVIFLTCGQLDRKQYQAINKVLEGMDGKWDRKVQGHIFSEDPTNKLEQVLLSGEITPPKEMGYFPTPLLVAKRVIQLAEIRSNMSVLEPSAGKGGIADFIPKDCLVYCVELLSDNIKVLREKGYLVETGDFLSIEPKPIYDRVVMNPPFEKQQDIDHVTHAWKFLKQDGKLVSVMSSGVLFRENKKTVSFREMIDRYGYTERLPEGSFKESGTGVNTCVVVLNQKRGK